MTTFAEDLDWTCRKTKWGWAICTALLAMVLTQGCACIPNMALTGIGIAGGVVTGDPYPAAGFALDTIACVEQERR